MCEGTERYAIRQTNKHANGWGSKNHSSGVTWKGVTQKKPEIKRPRRKHSRPTDRTKNPTDPSCARARPITSRAWSLLTNQPVQRLVARIEECQLSMREALEIIQKGLGHTLRADPRRALHVRRVEHQHFFHPLRRRAVNVRIRHIGKDKYRVLFVTGHGHLNLTEQRHNVLRLAMVEVDEHDALALMREK